MIIEPRSLMEGILVCVFSQWDHDTELLLNEVSTYRSITYECIWVFKSLNQHTHITLIPWL